MIEMIKLALQAFVDGVAIFKDISAAYKADAKLRWAQSLQSNLQPLESGKPTTDAQKEAAVKAVADAWANMP